MITAIGLSMPLFAAEQAVMRFDRYTVTDGLSQSSVMAIAQDNAGFMWFATENGLDRFDGVNFTNYRRERGNPGALASDFARDLHLAADGSLWVATDGGGLSRWDPSTDRFTTYRSVAADARSLAADRIRTLVVDQAGTVWVGTRGHGLDRLNPGVGTFEHYVHDSRNSGSLSHNDIYALAAAPDGTMWVGTRLGLNRIDAATGLVSRVIEADPTSDLLQRSHIRTLLVDAAGDLWIGTQSNGLCRLDTTTMRLVNLRHDPADPGSIMSNRVDALLQDAEGRIWAGTDKGLSLWLEDSGRFSAFSNNPADPTSLSGDSIFSIFQDRGGVIWIGTRTGGISKWNPRSWSFGHVKPDTSDGADFETANITSFTEDADGNTWVGTFGGGINVVDATGSVVNSFRAGIDGGLSDDHVMALTAGQDGRIWAGTMAGGLNEIDAASGSVTTHRHDPANPDSLAADGVMSVHVDQSGALWVGTFGGGVSRLDPEAGVFSNHKHDAGNPDSLSSPRATTIAESSNGRIWVGTDGGGLSNFDEAAGTWASLRHNSNDPASLSANVVYALHVDARDRLWVGTRAGLNLIVDPSGTARAPGVVSISDEDGLTNTGIYGIQSDSGGVLWLATSRGLLTYGPTNGNVRNFHEHQGLQGEEYNFGASFRSADGMMFFGGSNGYNAFRPEELQFNQQPPQIALTSLSIMNERVATHSPYALAKRLDLGFRDYVVTFGVAALDFADPANNRYAYKLEGFDEDWVDLGSERRITYTNLAGGDYTLRVKASNADGVWNETGISIPMSVANPPWRTWWAYSSYVLLVVLLILASWRHQQNKLQREFEYSRRLEREVRDRTKQLDDRNRDLKDANSRLLEASTTDALTGLRNRRFLFEQINKDVDLVLRHYKDGTETMKPGGNNDLLFLMVDLDNFKPVNDSCGHEAGDNLLLQVRDVLLDACRSSDDVIRWGGDEFLVIARDTNRRYAATLADRIKRGLSERVFALGNGQVARITSSIGYASFPFLKDRPELLSWEEILGIADAAMYEAKQKRNAWTGIEGIEWAGSGEELCMGIKSEPGKLADEGAIRAVESVEEVAENLA